MIQLSVASITELHGKAMIDVDGVVHLPLVGSVVARGLTLEELATRLRQQLKQKVFRQRLQDGKENLVAVDPDEVSVDVAEYRPVYVRGDVSKPGELAFRPGLTVRQSIALAGGYDVMRFHMENPFIQASDLRADYQALWTEYARQQTRAVLLKAEIDGQEAGDLSQSVQAPIPRDLIRGITLTESQQMKAQSSDYTMQRAYLKRVADSAQGQIDTFSKPRDDAKLSEHDDIAYKKRLGDLLDKGVIAHDRVADQQRSLLESTQRVLDYSQRISDLEKSRDDFNRQVEHLDSQHREDLYKRLQDTNVQVATLRAKLQSVGEKMMYTGAVRSQLVRGQGSKPLITIHHSTDVGGADGASVAEDTVLQPGDVIEVSLEADMVPTATSN